MTQYKNLVQDYPNRCSEILNSFIQQATSIDREVTLLLMATAGGFVMPYERLRSDTVIKPAPIDRDNYKKETDKLNSILTKPIKESQFFKDLMSKWRFSKPNKPVKKNEILDAYHNAERIDANKKVVEVVKIIRNSIAHGNVLSIPDNYEQIQDIIFLAGGEKPDGTIIPYKLIVLTPKELETFLFIWFELLSSLTVPQHNVLNTIDNMAV